MKSITLSMIVMLSFLTTGLFAQNFQLRGTIVDASNNPIIGASILKKGTTEGTITNLNGEFQLQVNPNSILHISYVGFVSQDMPVNKRAVLKIVLIEDTEALDEVIIIGYGTQKKSDITGSVTSVSGERIAQLPANGSAEALQGLVPGLAVNFKNGSPGETPSLQIRGVTSWGSSNAPLVIIDGTPGDISYLNSEDIKSMTVLKDAATAAIYGSRAAAGVILIETNRGAKATVPKLSFSSFFGINDLPKRMEICNSKEFVSVRKMALVNAGITKNRWPKYIDAYEKDPTQFADTDWQNEYYRQALTKKYNVGYTAGDEKMNVSFSGFYQENEGIIIGTDSKKYGFRLNSDVKRGKFKMGESVSYGRKERTEQEESGFEGMYQVSNIEPLIPVYDDNNEGGFGGAMKGMGMSDAANPVGYNLLVDSKYNTDYITASGYLQFEPIKDLIFKLHASRNMYFYHYKSFTPTYYMGATKTNKIASIRETRSKTSEDLIEFTGNYKTSFDDNHKLDLVFGISQEEKNFKDLNANGKKLENNDLYFLKHTQENYSVGGESTRRGLQSAFGRINYNYKYRYMLMASARYDGSSRFSEGNKWGFFPSVSAGWNIANEDFWRDIKNTVSTLKLRLSYGGLGNQSIGNYKYIPTLSYNDHTINYPMDGNNEVIYGYAIQGLPSSFIKWETTIYRNVGIDVGLWNNKLELSLEGYIKNTKDMLSTKKISACTGYSSLIVNDGKLRTTGLELQAIYHGNIGTDFKYDMDLNVSSYKSVLKEMADDGYLYENGPTRTYVGGEIGEFWVYQADGIFQSQTEVDEWNKLHGKSDVNGDWVPMQNVAKPGDMRFVDQNGDGLLDSSDKIKVGSGSPDAIIAFNINMKYKNFDLLANFYGNVGVKRYNYTKYQLQRMDKVFNFGRDALNAWTEDNKKTDVPRAVYGDPNKNGRISTRFVEDGDYLRLNNLQLGYNLSSKLCKDISISNLRIYLGATNLFTLTSYKGYDPSTGSKVGVMGSDYAAYPLSRSYILGLKFSF